MSPVLSIWRPGGSVAGGTENVYGAVPPPAIACPEKATPRVAYGGGPETTKASACAAVTSSIAANA